MPKPSCLTDYVLICMRDGEWWTFWKLQRVIEEKVRKYGEPSISAAIRNLSKPEYREKYGFDKYSDVYEKKSIYPIQKGYVYRITPKQLDYYRRKNV